MSRQSVADHHDAIVDLVPYSQSQWPGFAYALVKRTFRIADGACEPAPAEPLLHDIRDATLDPRLPVGSDFWIQKRATDVVVLGSAYAPGGRPLAEMVLRCRVAEREKRIAVLGTRHIEWTTAGRAYIGPPESFTELAVTRENAYGGFDARVPVPEASSWVEVVRLLTGHPGMYPRNPFGKGYYVVDERFDGIELPNIEDPDDRLTDERLVLGDPRCWHRQPLPWTLDWHHPLMFPRYVYLGTDARFPASDDDLAEVQRGYLAPGCRVSLREAIDHGAAESAESEVRERYYQEASLGMVFDSLEAGCPIEITGMHPERERIACELPEPPAIELEVEGQREKARPRLTNVILRPAEATLSLVYFARTESLPRTFLPGIHKHIPLSARIDGGEPVVYEPPVPLREQRQGAAPDEPQGAP